MKLLLLMILAILPLESMAQFGRYRYTFDMTVKPLKYKTDKYQHLVGDFDGDGYDEMILIQSAASEFGGNNQDNEPVYSWVYPDGGHLRGALSMSKWFSNWKISHNDIFVAGDFTGNGQTEILMNNRHTNEYAVAQFNKRQNAWTIILRRGNSTVTWDDQLLAGDFDGDGKDELLLVHRPGQRYVEYHTYKMNYHGLWWNWDAMHYMKHDANATYSASTPWVPSFNIGNYKDRYAIGDFDADGRDEIFAVRDDKVAQNQHIHATMAFNNNAWQFINHGITNDNRLAEVIPHAVADLDGDGYDDLVSAKQDPPTQDIIFKALFNMKQGHWAVSQVPTTESCSLANKTIGCKSTHVKDFYPLMHDPDTFTAQDATTHFNQHFGPNNHNPVGAHQWNNMAYFLGMSIVDIATQIPQHTQNYTSVTGMLRDPIRSKYTFKPDFFVGDLDRNGTQDLMMFSTKNQYCFKSGDPTVRRKYVSHMRTKYQYKNPAFGIHNWTTWRHIYNNEQLNDPVSHSMGTGGVNTNRCDNFFTTPAKVHRFDFR